MANIKAAKKAIKVIAKRTEVNRNRRSRMRTYVRKVEEAVGQGNKEEAIAAFAYAESELMRAAQKGVIHKNTAARKVSRLAHRIRKIA